MCIALIGGMDRLERHYINEAERFGINLKVFTKSEMDLRGKIKQVDAVVMFTNKMSHRAKKEVMKTVKLKSIPLFMYHSCGICTLRDCFECIIKKEGGRA